MFGRGFVNVFFIWSLLVTGSASGDEILDRLSALERKVEKLESEAIRRNELIYLLAQGITGLSGEDSEWNSSGPGKSSGESTSTTTQIPNQSHQTSELESQTAPVAILEARREILDSRVKFTVKYQPTVNSLYVNWNYWGSSEKSLDDNSSSQAFDDGTVETSVLLPTEHRNKTLDLHHRIMVSFSEYNSDSSHLMLILFNANEDAVETDIPMPPFKIEPPGDLVYEDGQDIVFEVTTSPFPKESFHYTWNIPLTMSSFFIDPDTRQVELDFPMDEEFEQIDNKTFPDHAVTTLKLKTSEFKTSGLLSISSSTNSEKDEDDPSRLVAGVMLNRMVIVRPSTQDGPFPPGYVSFVKWRWQQYDSQGAMQLACNLEYLNDPCAFNCQAVGNDIANIEIVKIEPDGSRTPLKHLERFTVLEEPHYIPYLREIGVSFEADSARVDSERFSCQATSWEGQTATQDIVITYTVPLDVLEDESGIQIENVKVESGLKNISFVCKVRGRPQPNVTFSLYTYSSKNPEVPPDEVNKLGNDEYSVIKYMTYDSNDPYSSTGPYTGKLYSASCIAESSPPAYGYDTYMFDIPDELYTQ